MQGELVFKLFGEHVLAVLGDYYVLGAAGYVDVAFLVYVAEVSGVEPAVADDFRGKVRTLVVSKHHVLAAKAYLAYAVLVRPVYPCSAAREGNAYGSGLGAGVRVEGAHRSALGEPVALKGLYSEGLEVLQYCRVDGGAARYEHAEPSAELLLYLLEEEVGYVHVELVAEEERDLYALLCNGFLALGAYALPDLLVQGLKDGGHAQEECRVDLLDVLEYVLKAFAVRNCRALEVGHQEV